MRFDTAIIGGGLAGLCCGIHLAEQGKNCVIISAGQSALHFSSGSLDFLNYLPNGQQVDHPLNALADLAQQAPNHPYTLLGAQRVEQLAQQAEQLLQRAGLNLVGHITENHQRITPMGGRQLSWLSHPDLPTLAFNQPLPWQNLAIIGIDGFLDFHPQLAASALAEQQTSIISDYLRLPVLDKLRNNPSEFRSINISRVLDIPDNLFQVADELKHITEQQTIDAIILPACFGLDNPQAVATLREKINKPIMLLPTLPPSILGLHIYQGLQRYFRQLGGQFMTGDVILKADIEQQTVKALYSRNHTDIPIMAQHVVLASGSFFSSGLVADFDRIDEPVFGLDLYSNTEREQWSQGNFFDQHAYFEFGVKTDQHLHGMINQRSLTNLYVVGALLGGYNPLKQGCGAGVALVSAEYAAQQILAYSEGEQ